MIFFGKKKIASIIVLFAFMGACDWFWRHREYIPFVSQPLSVGAAPFEYGVSRAAWFGENSIGMVQQIFTNWKDLETGITYERYCNISDKDHVKKILQMPVHFLQESGKGFFVKRNGAALALREELCDVIGNPVLAEQMKDVIDYRTMDYYQRRYREKAE